MLHDENLDIISNKKLNRFFQNKDIYIFDMDWVIINSEEINYKSYQLAIMEILHYNLNHNEYKKIFQWKKFSEWIKDFFNYINMHNIELYKGKIWNTIHTHKKKFLHDLNLSNYMNNGIIEFLSALKENEYSIWLATSTIREFTYTIINKIWILKFFDVIVTAEDVKQWKPSWEIYLKTFSLLKWKEFDKWVVFEDSIPWIQSALNAWLWCININYADYYSSLFWDNKNYIFWGNDFSFFIPFIKRWNI